MKQAHLSFTVKRHSSAFMKITKHSDIASEKIPFTRLHLPLFIVSMYFTLVFLENFRSIDTAFDTNPSSNSQSQGSNHGANNAICTHDIWLKKFRNEVNINEPKMRITARAEVWRQSTLPSFWCAPNPPRNSRSQPSFPDLSGPAHSPRAARSCKCVSCLPRPRPALPAGTPVADAVSGRDCWGSIWC